MGVVGGHEVGVEVGGGEEVAKPSQALKPTRGVGRQPGANLSFSVSPSLSTISQCVCVRGRPAMCRWGPW